MTIKGRIVLLCGKIEFALALMPSLLKAVALAQQQDEDKRVNLHHGKNLYISFLGCLCLEGIWLLNILILILQGQDHVMLFSYNILSRLLYLLATMFIRLH